jgi:hypothetical protein
LLHWKATAGWDGWSFIRPEIEERGTIQGVAADDGAGDPAKAERGRSRVLLSLLVASFVAFASLAVPRLTNNLLGDLELTGWCGPIAERIASGERPYVDFVLPIPPGSFAVLALWQKLTGHSLLLQELKLIAACQLGMALLAYAMVRPFTTRLIAVLVAFGSLVVLMQSPRECAFDQTALLFGWSSIALAAHALTRAGDDKPRRWLFALAGFTAGATFLFKQSTALGVMLGWLLAFPYLALNAKLSGDETARRALSRSIGLWLAGVCASFGVLLLMLAFLGSSLGAYGRAVVLDASPGASARSLGSNLLDYVAGSAAFPSSLVFLVLLAFVALRIAKRNGLRPDATGAPLDRRATITIALVVVLAFGGAVLLLGRRVEQLPDGVLYYTDKLSRIPSLGLFFVCLYFVVNLARGSDASALSGQRQNALLLIAVSTTVLHDLSAPDFRPFHANNPIIPFAFLYLFVALERAGLPRCRIVVFALAVGGIYSNKLDRALRAQTWVGTSTHWAGMRVNREGVLVVEAALRVQELAG